jgi:hypothetical protein
MSPLSMSIFCISSAGSDNPVLWYRFISTVLYFLIVILSWSAPLKFKYEQNIFDALNTVLLEADKNGKRMHYREIHRGVTNLLGSQISY